MDPEIDIIGKMEARLQGAGEARCLILNA